MLDKQQCKWLFTFLVYDSTIYDLIVSAANNGKLPASYCSMREQSNYLFNLVAGLPFTNDIGIQIIYCQQDFENDKTQIKLLVKTSEGLKPMPAYFKGGGVMYGTKSVVNILRVASLYFEAERNILVTYGHGSVVGINLSEIKMLKGMLQTMSANPHPLSNNKNEIPINPILQNLIAERFGLLTEYFNKLKKFFSKDFSNENDYQQIELLLKKTLLTNKELASALEQEKEKFKVDILVMYNCLMQNIYTQYELKGLVEYLVAPASGIGMPGFDYEAIYSLLNKKPAIGTTEAANFFIESIKNVPKYPKFKEAPHLDLKVSAFKIDADQLNNIKHHYDKLIAYLLRVDVENRNTYMLIWNNCVYKMYNLSTQTIADLKIVDASLFFREMQFVVNNSKLNQKQKNEFNALCENLVDAFDVQDRKEFMGNDFYALDYKYADVRYTTNKQGVGIILSCGPKMRYQLIQAIFDKNEADKDFIPSFVLNSNTGNFFELYPYPH